MSSRSRSHHEENHENGERWLLTYADMITLLLALFIVLFAMSTIDSVKFAAFKNSFRNQGTSNTPVFSAGAGLLPNPGSSLVQAAHPAANLSSAISPPAIAKTATAALATLQKQEAAQITEENDLAKAEQDMQAALTAHGLQGDVRFQIDSAGLHVRILTDQILYNVGAATLLPTGTTIIQAVAPVLSVLPNNIAVEGNTDNQPVTGGPFTSNWGLSFARADAVGQMLMTAFHISPLRITESGFADTRPIASNSTPAGQAQNRRVEILIESTVNSTPT
jgi:chemotaxis protein MotB